ncbi:unnamed protein product [Caenorhabditis brenneri]
MSAQSQKLAKNDNSHVSLDSPRFELASLCVEKQRKLDYQLALVEVRSNLDEEISQVMTMIETNPNRNMTRQKKVNSEVLAEAIHKILEENPVNQILSDIPATVWSPTVDIDPNSSTELTEAIEFINSVLGSQTSSQPSIDEIKENEGGQPIAMEHEASIGYKSKLRKRVRDSTRTALQRVEGGRNPKTRGSKYYSSMFQRSIRPRGPEPDDEEEEASVASMAPRRKSTRPRATDEEGLARGARGSRGVHGGRVGRGKILL